MRISLTSSTHLQNTETFIRDQINYFSKEEELFVIHDGRLPERDESGKRLSPIHIWLQHQIIKGLTGNRNSFFGNYGIKKFLFRNKIDVVIANYGLTGAHLSPICRSLNIPLIVIFHGHDATDRNLIKSYRHLYGAMFHYASAIVAVSLDLKDQLISLGANADKIHVIPCGVNPNVFNQSTDQKMKAFLAVGRFVPKKGPLYTIQAFHKVWQLHRDAQLIMAGPHAGLYKKCVALVNSLGMNDVVKFPGALNHAEVSNYMKRSYAFVQHSITATNGDTEGTPVSILEAACSGLAVVSTEHGGIKNAVIHGETGFLVKEGDIEAMAERMLFLLENPEKAIKLGMAGREHVSKNYHQKNQLAKIHTLARQIISNPS